MIKVLKDNQTSGKVPEAVKIGPHKVKVLLLPPEEMENAIGLFRASTMEISIDNSLSKYMQYGVFIHEIIEAINYIYDMGLNHSKISTLEAALLGLEVIG